MNAATKKPVRAAPQKRRSVAGSKGGESKQKQPVIASNSVPSLSTARIVYLWSWGPIVGPVNGLRSIRLNGTQVQADDGTLNYPGVKWQFRSGELNQERLEGIAESSNEIDVKKELLSTTPWLRTISNSVTDAVRIRFSWPTLRQQDAAGNINGVRIDYAVDISTDNGPYIEVLSSFVDRKNLTEYERAHRIELPAGSRWTIRARRLTPEANSDLVVDQMLVKAFAEVVDSDQEFPLTAVGCIEYDAQVFGGDIAKISALMRGRIVRVPANYNAETRTYATGGTGTSNGIWDGTFKEAYTNNPAWVFYDLVLHPYYGLGDRIDATMVDRWSLYRIAQYCDQMVSDGKGGQEPRFTCNLYFQKQAESYAVLQDLASIFHGMAFWDGSQIVVNADMPGDPVYTYNQSQILSQGAIKYEGTRARDRHTMAMVAWDNPEQGFETDKEPVFDDEALGQLGVVRDMSIDAFGCTSLGQAQRAGQWALMTEQLQTRGAVFRVGLDGMIPKPGQVIAIADPMLAGRNNGGRVAAVAGRVVTLDRDTPVPVGARLLCNLPSGKTEARVVKSVSGRNVTLMADYSELPEAQCGWVLDYDDLKLMQFYVRNITRPEWHQFQFEVIQHEPSKFDVIDHGAVVDTRPISGIPVGTQDSPARVLLSQHVVIEQGIANTIMTIAWDAAPGAVAYDIEWRWGAREWIKVPRTGELSVDVRGIYAGQYMARVRAVSAMQVSSLPTSSILTSLEGKVGLPPAVTHLTTQSKLFEIGFKWGFPPGAEDTQRTEIWHSQTNSLESAAKLSDLAYPQNDYSLQSLAAGAQFFFWARLVDRTGNIGPFYPVKNGVMGQASAEAGPILELVKGKIDESSIGKELNDRINLVDGNGPGSVNERINTTKTDLESQIKNIQDALEWVSTKTYAKGDSVRVGQKLYIAIIAVPANIKPPNATYWKDVGDINDSLNALTIRLNTSDQKITDQGTKITATQESLTALQTKVNDPVTGLEATANQVTQVKQSVTTLDGKVAATSEKVDGVYVQLNPKYSGDTEGSAGDNTVSVGVYSVWSAIGEGDYAQAKRTDVVEASVNENAAKIISVSEAVTTLTSSTASQIITVSAKIDSTANQLRNETASAVQTETTARVNADGVLGSQLLTVQTNLDGANLSIAQNASAIQTVDGKVSGTWSVRLQYTSATGEYKYAGVGMGLENGPGGLQSKFIIDADMFAIGQGGIVPFAVTGGQTFIKSAFIQDASINMLKIGDNLQSDNYVSGSTGWKLWKSGLFEINGQVAGQGKMIMTNRSLRVYDANNIKRVQLGDLTE